MTKAKLRTAIVISGRGSNMAALAAAALTADYPASIALVVSNQASAPGLRTAAAMGIETVSLPHKAFPSRDAFDEGLHAVLRSRNIEFVCLAGFMRLLGGDFVQRWHGKMISIHPALLPAFRGLQTHARAIEAGVLIHGCTVHYVVPELDAGPIVAQAAVPVLPGDTPDVLAARVLVQEHVIYPRALRLIASGRVRLEGARVVSSAGAALDAALSVPEEA